MQYDWLISSAIGIMAFPTIPLSERNIEDMSPMSKECP